MYMTKSAGRISHLALCAACCVVLCMLCCVGFVLVVGLSYCFRVYFVTWLSCYVIALCYAVVLSCVCVDR